MKRVRKIRKKKKIADINIIKKGNNIHVDVVYIVYGKEYNKNN